MPAYRIDRKGSVEEEYFTDQGEARARVAVLKRDPDALDDPTLSTERNHHWMADDAIWYCVRWTHKTWTVMQ